MKQSALKGLEYANSTFLFFITVGVVLVAATAGLGNGFASSVRSVLSVKSTAQESKPPDIGELKPGTLTEKELAGGETHTYSLTLAAGQYVHVVVEEKGIDVLVRLLGPNGQKLTEVDNTSGVGREAVLAIAEGSGEYRLEVLSPTKSVSAGRYEIKIEALREATSKDRVHVNAARTFEQGNSLRDQGTAESFQKALKKYEEALLLWQEAEDKTGSGYTLNKIGMIRARLGEPEKALERYQQAVQIWRAIGEQVNEADVLTNMGTVYWRLGDQQKALECYGQALPLRRAAGDVQGEAFTLNNVGVSYWALGQPQEALKNYNEALPLSQSVGDRRQQAVTLNNITTIYLQLGELQKSLEYLNQILPLRRAVGDRRGEALTLHNLGGAYHRLGEWEKALEFYNQSLLLERALGDRQNEAITLEAMSSVYARQDDLRQALDYVYKALALSRAVKDRRMEAYELKDLGEFHKRLGKSKEALEQFNQSLSVTRELNDRQLEIYDLNNIGSAYIVLGDSKQALEYLNQSLKLSRDIGSQLDQAAALLNIARAQSELGDLSQASSQVQEALAIIESTRTKVAGKELRSSFLVSYQDWYEFHIDLLMRMHRAQPSAGYEAAALQTSERARARGLLETLIEARAEIRQGVDVALLERERSLQQQLSLKSEKLTRLLGGKHTEEQATAAKKEVETLLTKYQDIEAQIRTNGPRYAALTQPQPLSLKGIQQELDSDTLLLEYSLGAERSYLWAVTPTSIKSFELPKRAEIEPLARRVYEALTARTKTARFEKQEDRQARIGKADAEYFASSAVLSAMLLGPVAAQLGGKRLLIVSEGALQYVPFGALPMPSLEKSPIRGQRSEISNAASFKPLIVNHEIVSLPSASTLAVLRGELTGRARGHKTLAVLADPVFQDDDVRVKHYRAASSNQVEVPSIKSTGTVELESEMARSARDVGEGEFRRLPYSRAEADGLMAFAPRAMRMESLDFEANRAVATSVDLRNYRILHFATHGLLDSQHPELSGLVLSLVDAAGQPQNGFLRLPEIYNMKLGADLVVLSACRTALGKEIKGEGLVGLTRGFMYAGAERVVASLWAVDDEITAELMRKFYREMLIGNQRPAAALRAAQVSIWKEKHLPPFYWAAFVLQGEWK